PEESHRLEGCRSVGAGRLVVRSHPCTSGETMVVRPKFLAWVLRPSVCRLSALAGPRPAGCCASGSFFMGASFYYCWPAYSLARSFRRRTFLFPSLPRSAHWWVSDLLFGMEDVACGSLPAAFPDSDDSNSHHHSQPDHFAASNSGVEAGGVEPSAVWRTSAARRQHY